MYLTGKFHSHITVKTTQEIAKIASQLIGGKLTVINLERDDRSQRDLMITNHYMTNELVKDERDVIKVMLSKSALLGSLGLEVIRSKLEHEPLNGGNTQEETDESFSNRIYLEIHVKCSIIRNDLEDLKKAGTDLGWYPSNNIHSVEKHNVVTQFLNKRYYAGLAPDLAMTEVTKLISTLKHRFTKLSIQEVKYESAIYDSNEELDRWWMI